MPNHDTEAMARAYESGATLRELARDHGVSVETVRRRVKKHGVQMRGTGRGPALTNVRSFPSGKPMAGTAVPSRVRGHARQTHPLVGADISRIHSAMLQSFRGRPKALQDIFDDMIDRDPRVASVTGTRVLAVQSRPWSVRPPKWAEGDAEAIAIAENVERIIGRIKTTEGQGWSSCIGQIADGINRGYAVSEIEWGISPEGWFVPKRLHWRHQNRFVIDDDLRFRLMDYGTPWPGIDLADFGRDKFVIHSPAAGRTAYPTRRGVMLGLVFPSITKRTDVKNWLLGTLRAGAPIWAVELPENAGNELKDDAEEMVNNINQTWVGVLWGGAKLVQVQGSGSLKPEIYREIADFCNTEIAVRALGQNLTTEVQGGSFAATTAHNAVRGDILAADIEELDGTITSQLVEAIVRYNWPGAVVPEYWTEANQQQPIPIEAVGQGIFSPDEYRGALGYSALPDAKGSDAQPRITGGDDPQPPESPPGGAGPDDPFAVKASAASTPLTTTSPTSARWTTGTARSLYASLVGSANTRSTGS